MALHPLTQMACDVHRALLHSPPGSSRVQGSGIDSVQIAPSRSTYRYIRRHNKDITPLPGFGIDRMLDFGWLGSASLWKSGPLFSTGTKEAELMVRELRVEPAVAGGAIGGGAPGAVTPERGKRGFGPGVPQPLANGEGRRAHDRAYSSPTTAAPP